MPQNAKSRGFTLFSPSHPARPITGLLIAALVVGLWTPARLIAATPSVVKTADYSTSGDENRSQVVRVSYSTGKAGHRLTWLPYRPEQVQAQDRAQPSSRPAQSTASAPVNVAQRAVVDPFADPFEDAKTVSQRVPRARRTGVNPFAGPFEDTKMVSQRVPPAPLLDDKVLAGTDAPSAPLLDLKVPAPETELLQPPKKPAEKDESLEELLAVGPGVEIEKCKSPRELLDTAINEISHDISPEEGKLPQECGLGDEQFQPRTWAPTTFTWKASGLCHKPAYFEDVHLERYGHSVGPYLQPFASGAHFFLTVPVLPYKMGLYPPNECIYTLGYYRPGSCAPYMLDPLPLSIRAALAEGAAWTGMALLIP